MRQVQLGSPSTLETLRVTSGEPRPPEPGEVLVQVKASSLNFHDYLVASGVMAADPGRVPLSDGAGEVVEVGAGVDRFKAGDRVLSTFYPDWIDGVPTPAKLARSRGEQVDGFATEYATVAAQGLTRAPAALGFAEAATLPCAGLTAWRALFSEGGVKPGDTVLVEGSGGVSVFALQFARMAGASVIAVSSTPEKMERLRSLGAEHVVSYLEHPEWGKEVLKATGGAGVDLVVEVVGGDLKQPMTAQRLGGRTLLIGALSRKPIGYASFLAIVGNRSVQGLTVGSRAQQEEMIAAIDANGLTPVVDRVFPMEEIAQAFRHQEQHRHFGKIALAW